MSKIKPVLGRGLDALMRPQTLHEYVQSGTSGEEKEKIKETEILTKLPIEQISPNPFQPRIQFDQSALEELKKSILMNGLIQPVTVRKVDNNKYQLVSGERRLKACLEIGYKDIPAYIIEVVSDEMMLAMALIENIQRERLNPLEIGAAYKRLMDDCNLTQEQIAERVGKDRSTVANSIRLLKLPKEIQDALIKDEISMGHARALINLSEPDSQINILKKIKENNLSVRKVEQLVKEIMTSGTVNKTSSKIFGKSFQVKNANLSALEDRLRRTFGTKVSCIQKNDGSGEIKLEYYSADELERLLELISLIEDNYN